jgi:hypothetical protein
MAPDSGDTITDFVSGVDKIDLASIDAIQEPMVAYQPNDAFTFIGNAAFTGAGQVRFSGGQLQATIDADAEMVVYLTGVTALSASDIIL